MFISILVGGVSGWLAGAIMNSQFSLIGNILLGVVGGFVGSLLLGLIGISGSGFIGRTIVSVVGACVLIYLGRHLGA